MFSTIRFIFKRIQFRGTIFTFMVIALILFPLLASADEDPCRGMGIYIGNQTALDIWYTRNGGPCTIWQHGHILITKPEDTLIIYKDMVCKTEYCSTNLTYDIFKSIDENQNCRVRILSDCTLSDM